MSQVMVVRIVCTAVIASLVGAHAALAQSDSASNSSAAVENADVYAPLARALAEIVREAIPPSYEREEDWGRTKRITTGLRVDKLKFSRRKKAVNHGLWKRYRIELVEPEKHLHVRLENLRSVATGKAELSLVLEGKFQGWAQARVYNRGLHVITLTTEGQTDLAIRVDFEVVISAAPSSVFAGIQLTPVATDADIDFRDFELTRFGELRGPLARELGSGLKRILEEELKGPKLVGKINRAIDKKRDRLLVTPDALVRHVD